MSGGIDRVRRLQSTTPVSGREAFVMVRVAELMNQYESYERARTTVATELNSTRSDVNRIYSRAFEKIVDGWERLENEKDRLLSETEGANP